MGNLTCFGVGDGWPCVDRNHASFLYRFDRTLLLVDCGESVDGSFKRAGVSYDSLDGILLSHMHSDHVGGLFMLMQGMWLEGRRRRLPIHLPGAAVKPLRGMLRAALLFESLMKFPLSFQPIRTGAAFRIGGVKATAFPTSHLDDLRARFPKERRNLNAYCFLFEQGKRRIGHSADLGRPEDLEPLLQKPLDLLVCELSHFSASDCFQYLRGRAIRQVVFVHLSRECWTNLGRTRRLAAKLLPGIPHRFAKDGDVIRF